MILWQLPRKNDWQKLLELYNKKLDNKKRPYISAQEFKNCTGHGLLMTGIYHNGISSVDGKYLEFIVEQNSYIYHIRAYSYEKVRMPTGGHAIKIFKGIIFIKLSTLRTIDYRDFCKHFKLNITFATIVSILALFNLILLLFFRRYLPFSEEHHISLYMTAFTFILLILLFYGFKITKAYIKTERKMKKWLNNDLVENQELMGYNIL